MNNEIMITVNLEYNHNNISIVDFTYFLRLEEHSNGGIQGTENQKEKKHEL